MSAVATPFRQDAEVISLVGFAHGTSHFFHLMFPPLFPWIMADFALGYAEAGLLMTAFFVVSGIGQALAGFLVDRFGSHRVLCAGIGGKRDPSLSWVPIDAFPRKNVRTRKRTATP